MRITQDADRERTRRRSSWYVVAGAWVRWAVFGAAQLAAGWLPYFPDPKAHCSAHGQACCWRCHRNPANCAPGFDDGQFHPYGCLYYAETGMHWDTCGNRVR